MQYGGSTGTNGYSGGNCNCTRVGKSGDGNNTYGNGGLMGTMFNGNIVEGEDGQDGLLIITW